MPTVSARTRNQDRRGSAGPVAECRWAPLRCERDSIGSHANDAGEPTTLFGSIQDVTDQVLAADALRKSEELYRMIADNVGDGIWLVELNTLRFICASPAVVQASGYSEVKSSVSHVTLPSDARPTSYSRKPSLMPRK